MQTLVYNMRLGYGKCFFNQAKTIYKYILLWYNIAKVVKRGDKMSGDDERIPKQQPEPRQQPERREQAEIIHEDYSQTPSYERSDSPPQKPTTPRS